MLLLFFLIIDLYLLIPAVIAQIFIPTEKLVRPTGIAPNEANAEIETQPVTVEAKISKCSKNLNTFTFSYIFHLLHC